ncbi:MAG: hypothetical protein K0R79_3389 [Stenotrophomonas indicatrix]|jgi:hypothetical protein|nr:hypothetical protein [Stenotrophomonas indicatrix]
MTANTQAELQLADPYLPLVRPLLNGGGGRGNASPCHSGRSILATATCHRGRRCWMTTRRTPIRARGSRRTAAYLRICHEGCTGRTRRPLRAQPNQTHAALLHRLAGQAVLERLAKTQLRTCRFQPEGFGHAKRHVHGDTCHCSQHCHGEQRTNAIEQTSLEQRLYFKISLEYVLGHCACAIHNMTALAAFLGTGAHSQFPRLLHSAMAPETGTAGASSRDCGSSTLVLIGKGLSAGTAAIRTAARDGFTYGLGFAEFAGRYASDPALRGHRYSSPCLDPAALWGVRIATRPTGPGNRRAALHPLPTDRILPRRAAPLRRRVSGECGEHKCKNQNHASLAYRPIRHCILQLDLVLFIRLRFSEPRHIFRSHFAEPVNYRHHRSLLPGEMYWTSLPSMTMQAAPNDYPADAHQSSGSRRAAAYLRIAMKVPKVPWKNTAAIAGAVRIRVVGIRAMPPCCIAWLDRPFSKAGPRIGFAPMGSSQKV